MVPEARTCAGIGNLQRRRQRRRHRHAAHRAGHHPDPGLAGSLPHHGQLYGDMGGRVAGRVPPAPVGSIPWRRLLTLRETWAYALGKFLIDPVWWMWLFWLPDFLVKRHHL